MSRRPSSEIVMYIAPAPIDITIESARTIVVVGIAPGADHCEGWYCGTWQDSQPG